jgi:hypothetical protein
VCVCVCVCVCVYVCTRVFSYVEFIVCTVECNELRATVRCVPPRPRSARSLAEKEKYNVQGFLNVRGRAAESGCFDETPDSTF